MSVSTDRSTVLIRTNHVPRLVIDGYELTPAERAEFDYYRWPDLPESVRTGSSDGMEATFFRYRGELYDLGEFLASTDPAIAAEWDGFQSDTFFSATVVRFVDEDHVVIGRIYA